ncbi:Hypothetical protein, putative [Bodo saltans]|uniref:Uncharacterized protein n=1 Tax=Bodo saltans TaxID=75058 RepID=A0A0S4JZ84_BODSA|nr:Hypothetical protein, putative [Bodo saltans]|eukprot:CUG93889.1 Hypothetical protein, putative [Bodo saltans]
MLLNLAPLVLGEPSPLTIETLGGCDILVLTNANFHRLSEYDIATLRQNALNIHCPFVKPLARTPMLRTIFQSSLSFDFLSKLQTAQIHQEPFVFSPGSKLSYGVTTQRGFTFGDPSQHYRDDYVAALILRGEIKTSTEARGTAVGHPLLWPDVTVMIFGCEPCEATCLTRVEAILLRRADIIETLLVALNETQLDTLCSALTNAFVSRVGRRPTMELGGVHPSKGTTQGRWKHLVSSSKEMSRASRPVHVVQPPSRNLNNVFGAGGGRRDISFVRSNGTSGQPDETTAPLDLYEGQKSGKWGVRHDSVAPSSNSGDDNDDDGFTPRGGIHRQSTADFLAEPMQRGEGMNGGVGGGGGFNAGRSASRVFAAAVYDPVLAAALASCEQYRQQQLEEEYYEEDYRYSSSRLYRSQHHRPLSATRPTSARPRVNHHLAPRTRLTVRGGLRSGGGYPSGLATQRTTGATENLTMHHSRATVGVTDKQKLHRTLEEFFS